MKVWLREDLVQEDLEDGRARYEMDADGNGFKLFATGCGLASAEICAGEPLNDFEMLVVEISSR